MLSVQIKRHVLPQLRVVVCCVGLSVVAAAGVVLNPMITAGALVSAALLIALLVAPLKHAVTTALIGLLIVPTAAVVSGAHGVSLSATPLGGQASMLGFITVVLVGRRLLEQERMRLPPRAVTVGCIAVGTMLLSVGVAVVDGTAYGGMVSDLYRQLVYPLGLVVGALAIDSARREGDELMVFRAIARLAIAASLLSLLYWAWVRVGQPSGFSVFADVRQVSIFSADRSIFPFTQDSPNVQSVAIVFLAALAFAPLRSSISRRDARLSNVMLLVVGAGVLTTQSRAGLLAFAVLPLPYIFAARQNRMKTLMWVGAVGLLVLQLYLLFPSDRRFSNANGLDIRQAIWSQAYHKFDQRPIFGQGYRYAARDQFYEAIPNPAIGAPTGRPYSIHMDYLEQFVDGGVVGGGLFLVLLVLLGRLAASLIATPGRRAIGLGFTAMFAALLTAMASSAILQSAAATIVVWLCVGIAAAAGMAGADVEEVDGLA